MRNSRIDLQDAKAVAAGALAVMIASAGMAVAFIVGIALILAIGLAFTMPIAFVLIWGANALFGLALPLTWTSVLGGAVILVCLRAVVK